MMSCGPRRSIREPPICASHGTRMWAWGWGEVHNDVGPPQVFLPPVPRIRAAPPAPDKAGLRRGPPPCHKALGEAVAIPAGDAPQPKPYELLAQLNCPAEARVAI